MPAALAQLTTQILVVLQRAVVKRTGAPTASYQSTTPRSCSASRKNVIAPTSIIVALRMTIVRRSHVAVATSSKLGLELFPAMATLVMIPTGRRVASLWHFATHTDARTTLCTNILPPRQLVKTQRAGSVTCTLVA